MRETKPLVTSVFLALLLAAGATLLGLGSCAASVQPLDAERDSRFDLKSALPIDSHVTIGRLEN